MAKTLNNKLQAVILAAGESSRFWPLSENRHKSLIKIAGSAIIKHLVDGLTANGIRDIAIVHAEGERGNFEKTLLGTRTKITYVTQNKPLGTGNALKLVAKSIKGSFLLVNGDHYQSENHIAKIISGYKSGDKKISFLVQETDRPWEYAIIETNKNSNSIVSIVEKPAKGKEISNIRTVGLYLLSLEFIDYLKKEPEHPHSLINAFKKYIKDYGAVALHAREKTSSIKYAFDVIDVMVEFANHLKRNVSRQTKISKNVTIKEKVAIGDGTEIRENVVIYSPAYIGQNCFIGANTVIRPHTVIEDNVQIGVGSEIKKSYIGEGTHIHSGYIGDSIIGENCRIGGGFTSANRRIDRETVKFTINEKVIDSGKGHLGCVVGANTKMGIRASTMPGTIIGSNCIIGSNTEVKGTIDSGTIIYTKRVLVIKKTHEEK